MKIIRVTGRGQLRIVPDETCLEITLEGVFLQYEEAMRRAGEDAQQIKTLLESVGFSREQIRTASFDVAPRYESMRDADGNYRQILKGYAYMQELHVRFPSDKALLARALYALSGSKHYPRVQIGYTVSDTESAKNALLHKAVRDAAEKARVLADAAGVMLGGIESVDYSWSELQLQSILKPRMLMSEETMAGTDTYEMDIDPEEINVSDTVTVVWSIGEGERDRV